MIGIIDYGMGNLRSVQKAFEYIDEDVIVTSNLVDISNCSHIVLPGVGAYSDAMESLRQSGTIEGLIKANKQGKPILGICLGMQMFFDRSYEGIEDNGNMPVDGLGLLTGDIVKFDVDLKIPHIGWNNIDETLDSVMYKDIVDKYFYFVHSFYLNHSNTATNATTDYGIKFACSVEHGNLLGVQFHPEKSGDTGLKLLKNFANIRS